MYYGEITPLTYAALQYASYAITSSYREATSWSQRKMDFDDYSYSVDLGLVWC